MTKKKRKPRNSILRDIGIEAQKAACLAAIAQYGTRNRAAQSLGISTMTLRAKLTGK